MPTPNTLRTYVSLLSYLELSHYLPEKSRKVQPVSLAKLGFDHERYLLFFIRGSVAVAGIEKLSRRAVGRPEHPDIHAEESIADVEGTLQLRVGDQSASTAEGRWDREGGG